MKTYIAYGSNMNVRQMAKRCPDAKVIGTALLWDWRLTFRGNGRCGVATIEPDDGRSVPVVLWKISKRDEQNLDIYEGYPHLYTKETVEAFDPATGKKIKGMAYIMTDGHRISGPSGSYLNTIAEGYDSFGMDTNVLLKIAVECGVREAMDENDD